MAGGLKEVRERIKSVIGTQQITKAMKMVSAAKLRKERDKASPETEADYHQRSLLVSAE